MAPTTVGDTVEVENDAEPPGPDDGGREPRQEPAIASSSKSMLPIERSTFTSAFSWLYQMEEASGRSGGWRGAGEHSKPARKVSEPMFVSSREGSPSDVESVVVPSRASSPPSNVETVSRAGSPVAKAQIVGRENRPIKIEDDTPPEDQSELVIVKSQSIAAPKPSKRVSGKGKGKGKAKLEIRREANRKGKGKAKARPPRPPPSVHSIDEDEAHEEGTGSAPQLSLEDIMRGEPRWLTPPKEERPATPPPLEAVPAILPPTPDTNPPPPTEGQGEAAVSSGSLPVDQNPDDEASRDPAAASGPNPKPDAVLSPKPSQSVPWHLASKITCGLCGQLGHPLGRCLHISSSGFMQGCPLCNVKTHSVDLHVHEMDEPEKFRVFVVNRVNKAPLITRLVDWAEVARRFPPLPEYPWSRSHAKQVRRGGETWEEHRRLMTTFDHRTGLPKLAVDPATTNDAMALPRSERMDPRGIEEQEGSGERSKSRLRGIRASLRAEAPRDKARVPEVVDSAAEANALALQAINSYRSPTPTTSESPTHNEHESSGPGSSFTSPSSVGRSQHEESDETPRSPLSPGPILPQIRPMDKLDDTTVTYTASDSAELKLDDTANIKLSGSASHLVETEVPRSSASPAEDKFNDDASSYTPQSSPPTTPRRRRRRPDEDLESERPSKRLRSQSSLPREHEQSEQETLVENTPEVQPQADLQIWCFPTEQQESEQQLEFDLLSQLDESAAELAADLESRRSSHAEQQNGPGNPSKSDVESQPDEATGEELAAEPETEPEARSSSPEEHGLEEYLSESDLESELDVINDETFAELEAELEKQSEESGAGAVRESRQDGTEDVTSEAGDPDPLGQDEDSESWVTSEPDEDMVSSEQMEVDTADTDQPDDDTATSVHTDACPSQDDETEGSAMSEADGETALTEQMDVDATEAVPPCELSATPAAQTDAISSDTNESDIPMQSPSQVEDDVEDDEQPDEAMTPPDYTEADSEATAMDGLEQEAVESSPAHMDLWTTPRKERPLGDVVSSPEYIAAQFAAMDAFNAAQQQGLRPQIQYSDASILEQLDDPMLSLDLPTDQLLELGEHFGAPGFSGWRNSETPSFEQQFGDVWASPNQITAVGSPEDMDVMQGLDDEAVRFRTPSIGTISREVASLNSRMFADDQTMAQFDAAWALPNFAVNPLPAWDWRRGYQDHTYEIQFQVGDVHNALESPESPDMQMGDEDAGLEEPPTPMILDGEPAVDTPTGSLSHHEAPVESEEEQQQAMVRSRPSIPPQAFVPPRMLFEYRPQSPAAPQPVVPSPLAFAQPQVMFDYRPQAPSPLHHFLAPPPAILPARAESEHPSPPPVQAAAPGFTLSIDAARGLEGALVAAQEHIKRLTQVADTTWDYMRQFQQRTRRMGMQNLVEAAERGRRMVEDDLCQMRHRQGTPIHAELMGLLDVKTEELETLRGELAAMEAEDAQV